MEAAAKLLYGRDSALGRAAQRRAAAARHWCEALRERLSAT